MSTVSGLQDLEYKTQKERDAVFKKIESQLKKPDEFLIFDDVVILKEDLVMINKEDINMTSRKWQIKVKLSSISPLVNIYYTTHEERYDAFNKAVSQLNQSKKFVIFNGIAISRDEIIALSCEEY